VRRALRLRRELRRLEPDLVISFLDTTNVLTLFASLGLDIPVIVSERVDPRHHPIGLSWSILRSLLYRYAAAVVVQSYALRDWASRLVGRKATHIIPNPISLELDASVKETSCENSGHMVVAMGRLAPQKAFDVLLKAFARCATKHARWSLVILGEGNERRNLEALAADLGIMDRTKLAGNVRDPASILMRADLFVCPSRYEGFPNALLEAMACGLAVIATDCPSGPREIVHDGVNGVLVGVDDVDALTAAMDRLMTNPGERQRLGKQAVNVLERFSIDRTMSRWDELIKHVYTTRSWKAY
jgi:glycosyltransferase involved in cell wall biosynthesis